MTVGEFLNAITEFAEKTPDTLVYFYWCDDEELSLYIKGMKANSGSVYLQCHGYESPVDLRGEVYLDAQVLVHLLSKLDPSSTLMVSLKRSGGEELIDVDLANEDSMVYDGENEICIDLSEYDDWDDEDED